jgi:hypothetical protein
MTIRDNNYLHGHWLRFVILFIVGFPACEEPFRPELDDFGYVLVVDGAITDQPGPYTISLIFSSGLYNGDQQAVEGAIVKIIEEDGEEETLTENQPGIYTTLENGIQGTAGKSYKLSIRLQDGTQYESPYQVMPASTTINSVGADIVYRYISIDEPDIPGYQFHITTELAENSEQYFMWSLESTYKYQSDFTIDYLYSGDAVPYSNPTEFMTCWRTYQLNEIYTFNTTLLGEPKIEKLPLNFARADARELLIRYSLLVKQFSINEEAFLFWNNIQRQIESQESLYNNQPFQIRGNIVNTDDPDEAVLGYFMVAAQSEKRIFIDPIPDLEVKRTFCEPDYMGYAFIRLIHPSNWPIYVYEDESGGRAVSNDECFDCRELGGTIIRPEFWED